MQENKKVEELTESVKNYINTNIELIKLQLTERISVVVPSLLSSLIMAMILLIFVLFISIVAGFYFSKLFGDFTLGFGIIAVFYLLLGIILLIGKKKIIENPLRDKIIKKIINNK